LKYIGLYLDLKQSLEKETPTNIGELQHMKYICDEIIFVAKYENLHTYIKTRLWMEFIGEISCDQLY
jgi:hypothetical protein